MGALSLAYVIFLSFLSVISHRGLKTVMNDLGNADQALWAAASGDLRMMVSNDVDAQIRPRLGIHANLIFYPLSLIYRVRPDPEILLVLTSVACGAAAIGLYALARAKLGRTRWAAVPALAFLASPIVHDANLFDFHVVTLVSASLVWAVWAFETHRRGLAYALLVLALICKEDVALMVIMLGAYLTLSGKRRDGLLVGALGVGYFLAITKLLVPAITGGAPLDTITGAGSRYKWLGQGMGDMLLHAIKRPQDVFLHINQPSILRLPLHLLLSGVVAARRGWRMLLLLLPPLAMGLLANWWVNRVTGTYYWITSEAVIVMAVILASRRALRAGRTPRPLVYLALATAAFSILLSPLPTGLYGVWENFTIPPERPALDRVAAKIPPSASISAQNNLGPQLSHRRDIASYPRRFESAEYAIFFLRCTGGPDAGLAWRTAPGALLQMETRELAKRVGLLISSADWGLIAQEEGFYLFQRGAPAAIDKRATVQRFITDREIFFTQCTTWASHRKPWARYLVAPMSWFDVARRSGYELPEEWRR